MSVAFGPRPATGLLRRLGERTARSRLPLAFASGLALLLALSPPARAADMAQSAYATDPALTPARTLAGVWRLGAYDPRLTPVWGGEPPFTAAGRRAYRQNAAKRKTEGGKALCFPFGAPRFSLSPWPMMILQTARLVTMVHEENRVFRSIRLATQHENPDIWDPSFAGEAIARWDGDVLVVDVLNFNGETWLDDAGLPASDQLHVVERWRKLEDGRLETVFTIDDPVNYQRAWICMSGWGCGEAHRSLIGVKNGSAVYVKPPAELTR